jgi:hypothetical protein
MHCASVHACVHVGEPPGIRGEGGNETLSARIPIPGSARLFLAMRAYSERESRVARGRREFREDSAGYVRAHGGYYAGRDA